MHFVKSVLLLLSGIVIGIAFVVAFGDEWLHSADAAADAAKTAAAAPPAPTVCDCPPAEPPLAGRFIIVSTSHTLPATQRGFDSVACPTDSQLISGSCVVDNATTLYNLSLEQSGFYDGAPTGWNCAFKNNEPIAVPFRVSAICLKHAP